jgi:hypothetical protein
MDTAGQYHDVVNLTEDQLQQPYCITSIVFIGKITQKTGLDNNLYDGFAIGVRADDEDMKLYDTPSAWLIEEDTGVCAVVLKVPLMSWLWAFGERRTSREEMWHDGHKDRASMIENGQVPARYVLVRFPRSVYLKNIIAPFNLHWTHRRIERSIDMSLSNEGRLIQDLDIEWDKDHQVTESEEWDAASSSHIKVRTVVIRGTQTRIQALRAHVQACFYVAQASDSAARRRADVLLPSNPHQELDNVYASFAKARTSSSPHGTRSSNL